MDYFELYYAYLAWCEKDNWANYRDPNHDFMEWNHTLPRCKFGDQPIGQWLTIKQHAIASALQTLAFKYKCVCPWHKNKMPLILWELCLEYYPEMSRKGGLVQGPKAYKDKTGIHTNDAELRKEWAARGGRNGKGKLYWNNGKVNVKSVTCPGPEWVRGILTSRWSEEKKKVKFQCTVTGFVSTSGGLTTYQKRRQIDPSNRIKLN